MLEINNTTRQKINIKITQEIVERFLRTYYRKTGVVSLAIVGDAKIRRLNREYRGIDRITDVLSFPAGPSLPVSNSIPQPGGYLGEIVINIREIGRLSKYRELWQDIGLSQKLAPSQVFYFLLVHGLLHLVGYDDATEKDRSEMLLRGKKFLEML